MRKYNLLVRCTFDCGILTKKMQLAFEQKIFPNPKSDSREQFTLKFTLFQLFFSGYKTFRAGTRLLQSERGGAET